MRGLNYFLVLLLFSGTLRAQTPADVPVTPLLWLKSDLGIEVENGKVSKWKDQSGNNNDAIQVNPDLQPTLIDGVLHDEAVINFDGTQFFEIPEGILGNGSHEEIQIFIVSATAKQGHNFIIKEDCQPEQLRLSLPYSVIWKFEETVFFDAGESSGDGSVYAYWDGEYEAFNLWSISSSNTENQQFIGKDMLPLSSDNSAVSIQGNQSPMFIGGDGSDLTNFDGHIAELIIFDQKLTESDQKEVERYLYQKYGLGHSWLNDSYNYSQSFNKSIKGIGRNDRYKFHTDSVRSDHFTVMNPTSLDDGDALIFGNDGQVIVELLDEILPAGYSQRIRREWRATEIGEVGAVDVMMDLVGIADWPVGDFALLVSDQLDFSDADVYTLERNPGTTVFSAGQVSINDGQFVSVAMEGSFEQTYPATSLDNFTLRNGTPGHHLLYPTWPQVQEWVYWTRKGSNPWDVVEKMNFRLKLPLDYDSARVEGYPLLVYFTGCGGMGRFKCSYALLSNDPRFDNNHHAVGLHDEAMEKEATDTTAYPGIIMIPQGDYEGWENGLQNPEASETMKLVVKTLEKVLETWNINRNQVSAHGFSNGGKATWDLANRRPDLLSSVLPMSATASESLFDQMGHLPIWNFQGELDDNPPAPASRSLTRFWQENGGDITYTEYPNNGHNTWDSAYVEPDFFSFMRRHDQRNIHRFFGYSDIKRAGGQIELGIAPGHLEYEWYLDDELIASVTQSKLTATAAGKYHVRFRRFDGTWEQSFDLFLTASLPVNQLPQPNAGDDLYLQLPNNEALLLGSGEDPDGTVKAFRWEKIKGPPGAILQSPDSPETTVRHLIEGIYTFRLTLTDNENALASDDVRVFVSGEPITEVGVPLIRINVGGTEIEADTLNWAADTRSNPNNSFTGNSLSTSWNGCGTFEESNNETQAPHELYCPYRVAPEWGNLSYDFPLQNGRYLLTLYFAERELNSINSRVFDVLVEDEKRFASLDLFELAGQNQATSKTSVVEVKDGLLSISFERTIGDPILSGIEIRGLEETVPENKVPIVDAGESITVESPQEVQLRAVASDPDGSIVAYQWMQISGPTQVVISSINEPETLVNGFTEGQYLFKVEVTDNAGAITADSVLVTVERLITGLLSPTSDHSVLLWPNPVQGEVNILLGGFEDKSRMRLYDQSMKLILERKYTARNQATIHTVNLDAAGVSPGSYIVVFTSASGVVLVKKLIKN